MAGYGRALVELPVELDPAEARRLALGAIREADTFVVVGSSRKIKARDLVRRLYRCELCGHEVLTIGAELGLRRSGKGTTTDAAVCYRLVRCPAAAHGWARCCGKFVQVPRGTK